MLVGAAVKAQSFPEIEDTFINDFAEILSATEKQNLLNQLQTLRAEHDIELTTVTIDRMSDYGHSGPIEPFATGLFNYWGIGDAQRNDGIMILVSRFDRTMRIEVGAGYGASRNAVMTEIIEEVMLPEFRREKYAVGLLKGVNEVIFDLTGELPSEEETGALQRSWRKIEQIVGGNLVAVLAIISGFGMILVALGRFWYRNRPRYCPVDGSRLIWLDEQMEDAHLDSGQQAEERLKSKDYDVWDCPTCSHVTVVSYNKRFSRKSACRSCGYKTLQSNTTIVTRATNSSTGLERIDYHCHHCEDRYSGTHTIPMTANSLSSSNSSGGGTSRSW